jgi:ankyrin repeat protein
MHRWLWLILLLLLPFSLHAEPAAKNANLWEALSGGNIAVAMDLVRAGANVNELHADGRPPLFEAMYQDRPALVSLMLEHGANANALSRPKTGAGAVAVAVTLRDDRPEVVQALLAHDASVDQC